jgi:hypothetical protein
MWICHTSDNWVFSLRWGECFYFLRTSFIELHPVMSSFRSFVSRSSPSNCESFEQDDTLSSSIEIARGRPHNWYVIDVHPEMSTLRKRVHWSKYNCIRFVRFRSLILCRDSEECRFRIRKLVNLLMSGRLSPWNPAKSTTWRFVSHPTSTIHAVEVMPSPLKQVRSSRVPNPLTSSTEVFQNLITTSRL